MGDGTVNTTVVTPALLGSGFATIDAGMEHSVALKTNGDLYVWGAGACIGDGTVAQSPAPKLIATGFSSIGTGYRNTFGIRPDGELYGWGSGGSGSLGDGVIAPRPLPMAVESTARPTALVFTPHVATYSVGNAIWPNAPTYSGLSTEFSVTPALPAGLTLDPVTGVLSGTPTATSPATSYTVTASGPLGSITVLLLLAVN